MLICSSFCLPTVYKTLKHLKRHYIRRNLGRLSLLKEKQFPEASCGGVYSIVLTTDGRRWFLSLCRGDNCWQDLPSPTCRVGTGVHPVPSSRPVRDTKMTIWPAVLCTTYTSVRERQIIWIKHCSLVVHEQLIKSKIRSNLCKKFSVETTVAWPLTKMLRAGQNDLVRRVLYGCEWLVFSSQRDLMNGTR